MLCDRFTDATLAYQGGGRGLPLAMIETLNQMATADVRPDLTLLLDMPASEGLNRAIGRNQNGNLTHEGRFEAETLAFHERVRAAYRQLAASHPRFRVIDGTGAITTVADRVNLAVDEFLAARGELTP